MTIRLVEPRDRDEWLRLLAGLYPRHDRAEEAADVDHYLAGRPSGSPRTAALLVSDRSDGRLNGFLELSVRDYAEGCDGPTAYLESWYVDPDARGTGIGTALVRAAEVWARERGHRELASDTELSNDAGLGAHLALGFEIVERAIHFRKAL